MRYRLICALNAAWKTFVNIGEHLLLLNTEEDVEHPTMTKTAAEYVAEESLIKAEDMLFEAGRYLDKHPAMPTINTTTWSSTVKGCKVSFRPMTHDDCELWFMQLEDVFAAQGIVSQVAKFAALTTLLTEEEAYIVRDLTMLGEARPKEVFYEAKQKFMQRYQLTVNQRITRALAMGGIEAEEKPSQWMARFRHTGGKWNREDVERWAVLRRLPPSLRTTLELPAPQLSIEELLVKADALYATLPSVTVSAIEEASHDLTAAIYACDVSAVNALLSKRSTKGVSTFRSKAAQQCWYHVKFGDDARCCSGPPCPVAHDTILSCQKDASCRETSRALSDRCRD